MVQQVNIVALMEDFQYFRSYEAAKKNDKSSEWEVNQGTWRDCTEIRKKVKSVIKGRRMDNRPAWSGCVDIDDPKQVHNTSLLLKSDTLRIQFLIWLTCTYRSDPFITPSTGGDGEASTQHC